MKTNAGQKKKVFLELKGPLDTNYGGKCNIPIQKNKCFLGWGVTRLFVKKGKKNRTFRISQRDTFAKPFPFCLKSSKKFDAPHRWDPNQPSPGVQKTEVKYFL